MDQQEKNPQTTEDKMQELFQLMEEKAAAGELNEIDEADEQENSRFREKMEESMTPMSQSEKSAYEFSMMMNQYEAMLQDYQRREAEEKAAEQADKEKDA
ncbi:MAG: hypothetical protein HFE99_00205 [Ruminiclostridium sp.]|jgi:hypothetical protein|nr:hypothetical protein [Ruminiclostridium sp.]